MERWIKCFGFPDYEVSDFGRIRNIHTNKILKSHRLNTGYLGITIYLKKRRVHKMLHILIVRSFRGLPQPGFETNHKDSDRMNCALSNLEYVTHGQNIKHGYDYGFKIKPKGSLHGCAKLSEHDILAIRNLVQNGIKQRAIAEQYRIDQSSVSLIISGRTWNHI